MQAVVYYRLYKICTECSDVRRTGRIVGGQVLKLFVILCNALYMLYHYVYMYSIQQTALLIAYSKALRLPYSKQHYIQHSVTYNVQQIALRIAMYSASFHIAYSITLQMHCIHVLQHVPHILSLHLTVSYISLPFKRRQLRNNARIVVLRYIVLGGKGSILCVLRLV